MEKITNSFKGLETGSMWSRLVYVYYLIVGLFFLAMALFTSYNVLVVWFKYYGLEEARTFRYGLFLAYILLNAITAYGFFFCKKWLIPILGSNVLVLLIPYVYQLIYHSFMINRALVSLCIACFIFASVVLTRSFLDGVLWRKFVISIFVFVLLLTLFITKTNLVY